MKRVFVGAVWAAMTTMVPGASSQAAPANKPVAAAASTCSGLARTSLATGHAIEAHAFGPNCASAVATIVVRDTQGRAAIFEATPIDNVLSGLGEKLGAGGHLNDVLSRWIGKRAKGATTADLPKVATTDKKQEPVANGFMPVDGYGARDVYASLRADKLPLYCFAEGGTAKLVNETCVVLDGDEIVRVGTRFMGR